MKNKNIVRTTFTSVWDGGFEIETKCKVDLATGRVFDIKESSSCYDCDILDDEYVSMFDRNFSVSNDNDDNEYRITDSEFLSLAAAELLKKEFKPRKSKRDTGKSGL